MCSKCNVYVEFKRSKPFRKNVGKHGFISSINIHQGDELFSVLSRGKQCAFMSLSAILAAENNPLIGILHFLSVHPLLRTLEIQGMPFIFNPGIPVGGGQTNLEFQWVGVKPTWNSSGWGSDQPGIPVGGGRITLEFQ